MTDTTMTSPMTTASLALVTQRVCTRLSAEGAHWADMSNAIRRGQLRRTLTEVYGVPETDAESLVYNLHRHLRIAADRLAGAAAEFDLISDAVEELHEHARRHGAARGNPSVSSLKA